MRLPVLDTKKLSEGSSTPLVVPDDELASPVEGAPVDEDEVEGSTAPLEEPLVGVDEVELVLSVVLPLVGVDEEPVLPVVTALVPVLVSVSPLSPLAPQPDIASERPRPARAARR